MSDTPTIKNKTSKNKSGTFHTVIVKTMTPVVPKAPVTALATVSQWAGRLQLAFEDGSYLSGDWQPPTTIPNAIDLIMKAETVPSLSGSNRLYHKLAITVHDDGKGADLSVFNETGTPIVVGTITIDPTETPVPFHPYAITDPTDVTDEDEEEDDTEEDDAADEEGEDEDDEDEDDEDDAL